MSEISEVASRTPFPKPPWPWPCPDDKFPFPMLMTGVSAGDLHGSWMRKLDAYYSAAGKDDAQFLHGLIHELAVAGLLGEGDREALGRVVRTVHSDDDSARSLAAVEAVYRGLVDDEESSPVAVAICAIALDSLRNSDDLSADARGSSAVAAEKGKGKGTAAADLAGALTGANIGKGGGLWGAIIGGLVGGIGMSYLKKRDNEKGDDKK